MKRSPYEPVLIKVTVSGGKPSTVKIRQRYVKVTSVINMWRIDEDWWRTPVSRMYFLLELENRVRISVFQDLIGGNWYKQPWMQE